MKILIVIASISLLIAFSIYRRSRRAQRKVVHIIAENCSVCQLCVKKCRYKVLEVERSETGKSIVLKYPEKCTACRGCITTCKFNALELVDRK